MAIGGRGLGHYREVENAATLGVSARAAAPKGISAAAHNRVAAFLNVTDVLLNSSFCWPAEANMRAEERTISPAGRSTP